MYLFANLIVIYVFIYSICVFRAIYNLYYPDFRCQDPPKLQR